MGALQDDTAVRVDGDGYLADLSTDWNIWIPNGGYLCAIALRAVGATAGAGHRPSSLSCQFLAPAQPGQVRLKVDCVRGGRTVGCYNVTMSQSDRVVLQAQVWTTNKTDGPVYYNVRPPEVARPAELATLPDEPVGRPDSAFRNNFDRKAVREPATEGKNGTMQRWSRYRNFRSDGDAFVEATRYLPLIDFLVFPTFALAQPEMVTYQAVSLDLSVWFYASAAPTDWLLVDSFADVAAQGLIHGGARIFNEDGGLLAYGSSHMLHMAQRSAG